VRPSLVFARRSLGVADNHRRLSLHDLKPRSSPHKSILTFIYVVRCPRRLRHCLRRRRRRRVRQRYNLLPCPVLHGQETSNCPTGTISRARILTNPSEKLPATEHRPPCQNATTGRREKKRNGKRYTAHAWPNVPLGRIAIPNVHAGTAANLLQQAQQVSFRHRSAEKNSALCRSFD
jgi:hypothetical protein